MNYKIETLKWNERKENYVKETMRICANNSLLSDSQHRALALLATYRHKLHKNSNALFDDERSQNNRYVAFLVKNLPIMLYQASLPSLDLSREMDILITKTQSGNYEEQMLPGDSYFRTVASLIAEEVNLKILRIYWR